MTEATSPRPNSPPPLPVSMADHMRPVTASQSLPEIPRVFMIHHDIMIPNLSIKEWSSRLFKFACALVIVGIAMLIPVLVYLSIAAAVTRAQNF